VTFAAAQACNDNCVSVFPVLPANTQTPACDGNSELSADLTGGNRTEFSSDAASVMCRELRHHLLQIVSIGCTNDHNIDGRLDSCFPPSEPLYHCPADFNFNGTVDSTDLFDFLTPYLNNDPASDFDRNCILDSNDYFAFLTAFYSSCTTRSIEPCP
jgi:hypothetical protein